MSSDESLPGPRRTREHGDGHKDRAYRPKEASPCDDFADCILMQRAHQGNPSTTRRDQLDPPRESLETFVCCQEHYIIPRKTNTHITARYATTLLASPTHSAI